RVRAEVDDMALLRLLARDSDSIALMPTVVAQDELRTGRLVELAVVPDLYENFYGVTLQRRFEPPLIGQLLARPDADILVPPTE
ncbi:MAG: LysR substrate-binding domain-containing protein, partial [Ilumatobacteraceae bacterium]